jgi:hypothetical protein
MARTAPAANATAEVGTIRHDAWEAAMSGVQDSVGSWEIPDDGTGVLNTDAFIASIGGFLDGLADVLGNRAEYLAEGPTNQVVVDQLQEFAIALRAMGVDSAQVYEAWRNNEDNAHDLRRAEGEINNASLFNV